MSSQVADSVRIISRPEQPRAPHARTDGHQECAAHRPALQQSKHSRHVASFENPDVARLQLKHPITLPVLRHYRWVSITAAAAVCYKSLAIPFIVPNPPRPLVSARHQRLSTAAATNHHDDERERVAEREKEADAPAHEARRPNVPQWLTQLPPVHLDHCVTTGHRPSRPGLPRDHKYAST